MIPRHRDTVTLFLFLFGLAVGSFLNVVIDRLPKGEGIIKGRSYCPKCGHVLAWYDLVPVLSFVILRGRCRYCRRRIPFQYPMVELATGALFATGAVSTYQSVKVSMTLLSTVFLIPIFVIDLKHGIIPDRLVWPGILLVTGYRLLITGLGVWRLYWNLRGGVGGLGGLGSYLLQTDFFKVHAWLEVRPFLLTLAGSLALYSSFFILHSLFKGRALGGGDVKLAALVGLITGFPGMIVAIFAAFLTGALASIILMMLKKKKFGETIPFGPFLVVGTYVALFFGDNIIKWYLRLL